MTSPLITTGTAGGQETVGEAQMRPSAFSTSTVSLLANTASRIESAFIGFGKDGGRELPRALLFLSAAKALYIRSRSSSVFSGVAISTRQSRSANSGSMPHLRRCSASSSPEYPQVSAEKTSLSGSVCSLSKPRDARRSESADSFFMHSESLWA